MKRRKLRKFSGLVSDIKYAPMELDIEVDKPWGRELYETYMRMKEAWQIAYDKGLVSIKP